MSKTKSGQTDRISYYNIRNLSTDVDKRCERQVYCGVSEISQIAGLSTEENLRDFLPEAAPKRRKYSAVHREIEKTLSENPDDFSILNSGVTLVASSCDIDDKNNRIELTDCSIINGAQTQGVIKDFLKHQETLDGEQREKIYIGFELIVTKNPDLFAEIAIARNFQNNVSNLSIVGKRKKLDELQEAFEEKTGSPIRTSETDLGAEFTDTLLLLQVIFALLPKELSEKEEENKVYTYSQKARCLKKFEEVVDKAEGGTKKQKERYKFFLDICADAKKLYDKWKKHQGFKGSGLHAIKRDEQGNILDVPSGVVFPIISSLSEFVVKKDGVWTISPPEIFEDRKIIDAAKTAYIEIAKSNPNTMGKNKGCYSYLSELTSVYRSLSS